MDLVEKFQSTEPAQHAHAIEDVLYYARQLSPAQQNQLRDAQNYLERLAWKQIEDEIPQWMREWVEKQRTAKKAVQAAGGEQSAST